jgi:hypothetical protein
MQLVHELYRKLFNVPFPFLVRTTFELACFLQNPSALVFALVASDLRIVCW